MITSEKKVLYEKKKKPTVCELNLTTCRALLHLARAYICSSRRAADKYVTYYTHVL